MPLEVMEHKCDYCGCIGPGVYLYGQESPYRPETRFRMFMCIGCQKERNKRQRKATDEQEDSEDHKD